MPKVTGRKVWKAEVELEINRLALSAQYVEKGSGSKKKRYLVPTDWLDSDGETILFDIGKRLKGWLKEQIGTMKTSWKPRIQYGIVCKSLPKAGYVPIAELKDIAPPSRNWDSFQHKDDYELGDLPAPNVEVIILDRGSIFALHYVLNKPVTVKAEIYSFAYGVRPESVQQWLETLGPIKGLGDLHSSSAGYGTFTVKSFEVIEEKELSF